MALKFVLAGVLLIAAVQEIQGHGMLMDPVNRSSAWRKGFPVPPNYNDNENFCGGFAFQTAQGGKCGACGDRVTDSPPRANENGGTYGKGVIVKTYKSGQQFKAVVNLSANHKGYFKFALCPLNGPSDVEKEECFDAHPVKLANGEDKYYIDSRNGDFEVDLVLPQGFTCKHCSFRWHYTAGNNWGQCENGKPGLGCGPQETFRGCADITIA